MGKVLPSLVFAAAVLGALMATLVSGSIVALVPLVGVVVAVWLLLLRHRNGYIAGGLLLVWSLAALVLAVGGVSFRGDGIGDGDAAAGHATAVATAAIAAGALLGVSWGRLEPAWMPFVWLIVLLVAVGLAYGLDADLGNPTHGANYATGLLALAAGVPALLMLVRGEEPYEA